MTDESRVYIFDKSCTLKYIVCKHSMMQLRPSDIYFTQDSISPFFDKQSSHSGYQIGETLDDICENRCSIYEIPRISVIWWNGKWFTADNRRLWIFRHLERLGKCSTVPVYTTRSINPSKFTTLSEGESVSVRGFPGGRWYLRRPSQSVVGESIQLAWKDNANYITNESRLRHEGLYSDLYRNNPTYYSNAETGGDNDMCVCLFVFIIIVLLFFSLGVHS